MRARAVLLRFSLLNDTENLIRAGNDKTSCADSIAGLDPSGGAGIVADIKTIAAFGCFPAAALTSITFQNTTGVFGAEHQTAATLRAQVEPIVHDLTVAAAKTGMLPTAEIVAEVARLFAEENLPAPVVDPVVVATSGDVLIDEEAFEILKTKLFPLARVVTPNIPEAEKLAGLFNHKAKQTCDAQPKQFNHSARAQCS